MPRNLKERQHRKYMIYIHYVQLLHMLHVLIMYRKHFISDHQIIIIKQSIDTT